MTHIHVAAGIITTRAVKDTLLPTSSTIIITLQLFMSPILGIVIITLQPFIRLAAL